MSRARGGQIVALRLLAAVTLGFVAAPPVAPLHHAATKLGATDFFARLGSFLPAAAAPETSTASVEPVFPYLEGESTDETLSVGDTSSGRVVLAKAVSEGECLAILPKQRARDLKYGTREMVAMLESAADALYRETGTRLFLGNIGKRGGGDIPFSVSHNAGRDADVALSYLDASGSPVDPPDLVPLGKDGYSRDRTLSLDARRTWITIRALVAFADTDVEYLFLSDPLRKKVLTWAKAHGEKPALIERASQVLRQPVGAAPHDDHLHVRIYCSPRDLAAGCVDTGPGRLLGAKDVAPRAKVVDAAMQSLGSEDPGRRTRAVLRLALLGLVDRLPAIAKLLDDPSPNVRFAAVTAIGKIGRQEDVDLLLKRFLIEPDAAVRERIVLAAAVLGGTRCGEVLREALVAPEEPSGAEATETLLEPRPETIDLALDLLDGKSLDVPLRRSSPSVKSYAAAIAGRADRLEPVPALVTLLDKGDTSLRACAAESLALITNHRFGEGWSDAQAGGHADAIHAYEALWKKLQKSPRDAWIALGFNAAGFKVRTLDKTSVWELVRATAGEPHLSYNAREMLARIADERPASVGWSAEEACSYYLRVFQERKRFHLDKPPPSALHACSALKKI